MTDTRYLVIFAKAPRMGRVKTRLARDIGMIGAWRFYRQSLTALVRRLNRDRRWKTVLCVAPDTAAMDGGQWPVAARLRQGGGDLGQRMQRAFDTLPPGPVVLIGADIPGIGAAHIARAFRSLGHHDAVFGPAGDGGYWLVGLRRRPRVPRLFAGVRWSGPHALDDTLANLDAHRVAMIDTLADVDDGEDFERWRAGR